jgi:hypothetical protein
MLKHFPLAKNWNSKILFQHLTMGIYVFSTLIIHTFCKWEKINHVVCCKTRGVSHYGLAVYILKKSILRPKKNYPTSNISPCKSIIFKKNPTKKTKIVQDIITL